MEKEIRIRKAEKKDLLAIYNLVKELAVYENEPDAVTATLEDYQKDFSDRVFQSIVAEKNEEVIGMMLYFMAYSTWKGKMMYLDDFVVNEKYRRHGVGQKLYDAFLDICEKEKVKLVKWQVLDWNKPAIKFYEKNNTTIEKGWLNVKKIM